MEGDESRASGEKEGEQTPPPQGNFQRKTVSDAERIRELRERLYARGRTPQGSERHSLAQNTALPSKETPQAALRQERNSGRAKAPESERLTAIEVSQTPIEGIKAEGSAHTTMNIQKSRRSIRFVLTIFGVVFFLGALAVSTASLFLGKNIISGQNITISATGPLSVSAGSEFAFQVAVANLNSLPIESATLIIEYPHGTKSTDEPRKDLFSVRQPLNRVGTGEVINVPLKVVVFGEENEEKVVKVAIEYRISGSNATFYKEAEPLNFKVGSSPVAIAVDSLARISSGQELVLTITVNSNSPTPLSDLVVKASYPYGFDFTSSDPSPVAGEDTWSIPVLEPGGKKTFVVRGIMTGKNEDSLRFTFGTGVSNGRDQYTIASTLANTATDVAIEQPFLGVKITVNSDRSDRDVTVITPQERASVGISFQNALDTIIYNGKIKVELKGNALNEIDVNVSDGFYDSLTNTITWDSVDTPSLKEIAPGKEYEVGFTLAPQRNVGQSPELYLKVTAEGQRLFNDRVPQQLAGVAEKTIRIESAPKLYNSAVYTEGPFVNTGPTPPVAERVTQYTFLLTVNSGSNDLTGASLSAVLPQYVRWLDLVSSGDVITYDPSSRSMRWNIGNMQANSREEAWVQVAVTPSLSQVGRTPVILETQQFVATDRFTGTTVRTQFSSLNTSLTDDPDPTKRNGVVQMPD